MKLEDQEISQIESLQKKNEQLITELGRIEVARLNLDLARQGLEATLKDLRQSEEELMQGLTQKYGVGSVDMRTGEFVPAQLPTEE